MTATPFCQTWCILLADTNKRPLQAHKQAIHAVTCA